MTAKLQTFSISREVHLFNYQLQKGNVCTRTVILLQDLTEVRKDHYIELVFQLN